jgi:hypothetical protein
MFHTRVHTNLYICMHICMRVFIYVHTYIFVYVFMHVCGLYKGFRDHNPRDSEYFPHIHAHKFVCVYAYRRVIMCVHTYLSVHTCLCMYACVFLAYTKVLETITPLIPEISHAHIHTSLYVRMCVCPGCIYTCMYLCKLIYLGYMHAYIYIHTYTYTGLHGRNWHWIFQIFERKSRQPSV